LAPHARRVDQMPVSSRYDRLRRETRFQAWATFFQMLRFSSGGTGAVPAEPVAAPAAVTETGELKARNGARPGQRRRRRRGGSRSRQASRAGQQQQSNGTEAISRGSMDE